MRWMLVVLILVGCASIDKERLTRIQPNNDGTYSVRVFVNTDYTLEGKESEQQRLDWVAYRVKKSGVCSGSYDVVNRQVINGSDGLLGKTHQVFYTVRCT